MSPWDFFIDTTKEVVDYLTSLILFKQINEAESIEIFHSRPIELEVFQM